MDIKDSVSSKGEQERNVFSKNEMETTTLRKEKKIHVLGILKTKIQVPTFFTYHWSNFKNCPHYVHSQKLRPMQT